MLEIAQTVSNEQKCNSRATSHASSNWERGSMRCICEPRLWAEVEAHAQRTERILILGGLGGSKPGEPAERFSSRPPPTVVRIARRHKISSAHIPQKGNDMTVNLHFVKNKPWEDKPIVTSSTIENKISI